MEDDPGFNDFMVRKLAQNEVLIVRDKSDNNALIIDGIPARRVYKKFGFVDYDLTVQMNGYLRSLIKKFQ